MSQSKENYVIHNKNYHYLDNFNRLVKIVSKRIPMNPKKVYRGTIFHDEENCFKNDVWVKGCDISKCFTYLGYTIDIEKD